MRFKLLIFDWNGTLYDVSDATTARHGQLYPEVPDLLWALAAEGYALAVATAASKRSILYILEDNQLESLFSAFVTADDGYYKPQAEVINKILDATGFSAAEALMIGDTLSDLQCAKNAKVAAVAIRSGPGATESLMSLQPLVCLASVVDLPNWLACQS